MCSSVYSLYDSLNTGSDKRGDSIQNFRNSVAFYNLNLKGSGFTRPHHIGGRARAAAEHLEGGEQINSSHITADKHHMKIHPPGIGLPPWSYRACPGSERPVPPHPATHTHNKKDGK